MDKKKKIRYLSIKQEKLEKKLIAEIEKFATGRPKIPKDTQNPYQYLTTFNTLIGYFREKPRPNGSLFTWTQGHQPFSKISVPQHFESEYKEGGKKVFTKAKLKTLEEAIMNKNYNSKFFDGVDFTTMNNVIDLLDNQQLADRIIDTKNDKDDVLSTHENNKSFDERQNSKEMKIRKGLSTKTSGDTFMRASFSQKKTDPVINYDSNLDRYKSIITSYGRQLISSENFVKHRKLFNITKIQDKTLYGEDNFKPPNDRNDEKIRAKTEGDDFYLNPFDLKNFSVNKILSNIHERNQDKFHSQIDRMREHLKSNSAFLKNNKAMESKLLKLPENLNKKEAQSTTNMSSVLKSMTKLNKLKTPVADNFENSELQASKFNISPKLKKGKHKSYKQKISNFNNGKVSLKIKESDGEIYVFRNEFSDKLEKGLTNFQKEKIQQPILTKYTELDDDNIFNYNAYFKKRYYNKGMRLDLSEKTKKVVSEFEHKINNACKLLSSTTQEA